MGFFDESAPQTIANTVKLWYFMKPEIVNDLYKYKSNTFSLYSINDKGVVRF